MELPNQILTDIVKQGLMYCEVAMYALSVHLASPHQLY